MRPVAGALSFAARGLYRPRDLSRSRRQRHGSLLPSISHSGPKYQWFNAQWEELLTIDWSAESISGGAEVNFVHQPTLERAVSDTVATLPNVHPNLGWEAVAVEQNDTCL